MRHITGDGPYYTKMICFTSKVNPASLNFDGVVHLEPALLTLVDHHELGLVTFPFIVQLGPTLRQLQDTYRYVCMIVCCLL